MRLAGRKFGLAKVPVTALDHLSEMQRRAYVLANKPAALNAGRNESILGAEVWALAVRSLLLRLGFAHSRN